MNRISRTRASLALEKGERAERVGSEEVNAAGRRRLPVEVKKEPGGKSRPTFGGEESAEAGGGNIKPTCGEDSAAERQEPREKGEYQEGEDPARREGGIDRTRPRRLKRRNTRREKRRARLEVKIYRREG